MRTYILIITLITYALAMSTFMTAEAKMLTFDGDTWTAGDHAGSAARIESFDGRQALYLKRNSAVLDGPDMNDLVIEYEYASTHASGFIGVDFRVDTEANSGEQFYTRPHQSGQPDATQYMVSINGVATWQLHAGPNEATATDLPAEEWIKVKIVAIGDKADVYVTDMETPLLHIPDLRFDGGEGHVALYASDRPWRTETGAYFSNISVRKPTKADKIIGKPRPQAPLPDGLITRFEASTPFSETAMADIFDLEQMEAFPESWQRFNVEDNGVANIARTTPLTAEVNTVLVRFKITSDKDTNRLLSLVTLTAYGFISMARLCSPGMRNGDHAITGSSERSDWKTKSPCA